MFAYCTVLGLPLGHLVYAAGGEQPIRHTVRRTETTIQTWTLDLTKSIPHLLADLRSVADNIASGA